MSKWFYIQLNDAGLVIAASELCGQVDSPFMVQTDVYRPDLIGKQRVENDYIDVEVTPVEQPVPPKISDTALPRKITVNAFRGRFTPQEAVAFENALVSSAELRVLDKRLAAIVATHVDLDDPMYSTVAMPALVAAGILTAPRATEILSAAVLWRELPPSIQQQYIAAGYQIDV